MTWDVVHRRRSGLPYDRAKYRELAPCPAASRSGWCWSTCSAGPDEVLLLDEPDNFLDVPGKIWLEQRIRRVRQDDPVHQPRPRAARQHRDPRRHRRARRGRQHGVDPPGRLLQLPRGPHATASPASRSCASAGTRSTPSSRSWCCTTRSSRSTTTAWPASTAPPRPGCASSRRPGRPPSSRASSRSRMRLQGGRTGKRAVVCEGLELTGLMRPFDLEVWYGERVAVLGSNGSGKSPLPAPARRRRHRPRRRAPAGRRRRDRARAPHRQGQARRPGAARLVRPDPRAPRAARAHPAGGAAPRRRLARRCAGDGPRAGRPGAGPLRARPRRGAALRVALAAASRPASRSCCSSCPAPRCCCSTSPPTTSTCSRPRRWRRAWTPSTAPSLAVTHDRWFARGFDRFLVYGADGEVYESDGPVWDEGRVVRTR